VRIETLATGDELLTGLIADTNSTYFQQRLLERFGLTVRYGAVVPDLREDIIDALNAAAARADAVLVSGGLGPTADDFTAECAAKAAGVELVEHAGALEHIRARFKKRGIEVTSNNLRQAQVPRGAEVVLNAEGSAPGFVMRIGRCTFFFVPGVPREHRWLVDEMVLPRIETLGGASITPRALAVIKTTGIVESKLEVLVAPLVPKFPRVTFGYRTHPPENHLKLLGPPADVEAARVESLALIGELAFGAGDETLPGVVGAQLSRRQERLALAESCTGGLVAAELTSVPGASGWLESSAVTYTESAKQRWAGVEAKALAEHGAVSEVVAKQMAHGVRAAAKVEWGASVTGYAGPTGGTEKDPVGTVYLAVAGPNGFERTARHSWTGMERERIRRAAAWALMDLLRRSLKA
jgi:nicotinamide-nucleotide amidase